MVEGLTVVAGQTPAAGHTLHARGEDIAALTQTHRGDGGSQDSGGSQLDEGDVVVDGSGVPFRMGEDLQRWKGVHVLSQLFGYDHLTFKNI